MTHLRVRLLLVSITLLTASFLPSPLSAKVIFNEQVPIPFLFFVPCANDGAGEFVLFTGLHHVLVAETTDAAGGTHSMLHLQPSVGFVGTGLTSGDAYEGTGVVRGIDNISGNGATESTFVYRVNIVGIGKANDLQIYQLVHFTFTPNGVTAEVIDSQVDCR
jgi:hypothetical protein